MSRGLVEIIGSIFAGRRKSADQPASIEIKLPAGGDFASIYSRNPNASILASVLTKTKEGTTEPRRITPTNDNRPAPVSKKVGAGDELRRARETVLSRGEELAAVCDPAVADFVKRLLTTIEAQHCSIAFIGQMNAGKSSLINAFIGAPKFLPAEITPWTTVVTNLYFGVPKLPTSGALFEFFNQTEWQQLAEGSLRVRTLTERLVPNFPWEDFYRQVGNMREKAEEKLGARYSELLGSQHAFPEVSPHILEKYIAAESPLGDVDGSSAGEFSMITKAAHLYFDLTSFFYPTIVIDTPGVNDPFLVRDEITRQNLERANVFIIVVTARQPLSNADLDLLRVLRGLRKDNIIIFVNKVDELDDAVAHAGLIEERIRGLLKKEFPASDIRIVMGSALWAETALAGDPAAMRSLAEKEGWEGIRGRSLGAEAGGFWLSDESIEQTMLSDSILMRSGVADLALAVSEMLGDGTIANSIAYAGGVLAAIARNGRARAEANAALAAKLAGGAPREAHNVRLEAAGRVLANVRGRIEAAGRGFDHLLEDHEAQLSRKLKAKVAACIDALRTEAAAAKPGVPVHAQFAPLVVRLRSELEQAFLTLFHQALQDITARTKETEAALRRELAAASELLGTGFDYPALPALKASPSLAALGEPVATDLGGVIQGWGAKPVPSPERAERMKAVIAAEFEGIITRLAKAGEAELDRTITFVLDHMGVTAQHALQAAIAEQRSLLTGSAPERLSACVEAERKRGKTFAMLAHDLAAAAVSP